MPQPRAAAALPEIPAESLQEGARWRFHRPSSQAVAEWFHTVPLDEGMKSEDYVGGVVIIGQSEKVKYQVAAGTSERYEMVYTPYVQIGTRVGYFRRLAELRDLRMQSKPAEVPRSKDPRSPYFNANMTDGLWWHVVTSVDDNGQERMVRYLCATHRVALYEPSEYGKVIAGQPALPVLEAFGTKQVKGGPDENGLMKAQTGATGRALGAAGILVVGTGIATAEDMMEFSGGFAAEGSAPALPAVDSVPSEVPAGSPPPESQDPAERLVALRTQAMALQEQMQSRYPAVWTLFSAWWTERAGQDGWKSLDDVPEPALRGIIERMTNMLAEAQANAQTGAAS